jgi:hypothetical protein
MKKNHEGRVMYLSFDDLTGRGRLKSFENIDIYDFSFSIKLAIYKADIVIYKSDDDKHKVLKSRY